MNKTLQLINQDKRIEQAYKDSDGYWFVLNSGYINSENGTHGAREDTVKALKNQIKYIKPCNCRDCKPQN